MQTDPNPNPNPGRLVLAPAGLWAVAVRRGPCGLVARAPLRPAPARRALPARPGAQLPVAPVGPQLRARLRDEDEAGDAASLAVKGVK